MSTGRLWYG